MRAAWGALKGAVQELNDALLEDEDDEYIKHKKDVEIERSSQIGNNTKNCAFESNRFFELTKRNQKTDIDFNKKDNLNNLTKNSSYSQNNATYKKDENTKNLPIFQEKIDSYYIDNSNKNTLDNKSRNNSVIFLDSETINLKNSSDSYSHDHLKIDESTLNNKSHFQENIENAINGSNEKFIDQYNEDEKDQKKNEFFEYLNHKNNKNELDYCDQIFERALGDEREFLNEEIIQYSDDKTESNNTNSLEDIDSYYNEEENQIIYENSINDNTEVLETENFYLPKKYSLEFEKIFHMEINDVDTLCQVIQGYYSDWKGIRNTLMDEKDLILKISPSHFQFYLKNNVLSDQSFSLGFTVLIGQCITSFLNEIKNQTNKIEAQNLKIEEFLIRNDELNQNIETLKIENSNLSKNITELEDVVISLKKEHEKVKFEFESEFREKNEIDLERLKSIEDERNKLISKINQLISEKEHNKTEIDKLHEHIGNLTSIIEGYQAEEDQINARYEIELEKARSQERKLLSKLSILDSCQDEIKELTLNIEKLKEERDLFQKRVNELQENNKNLFESNELTIKQLSLIKEEQKEYMIDKRFLLQLIQKHNEEGSTLKYRNDLFDLLCDAIGVSEEYRSKLTLSQTKNGSKEIISRNSNQNIGFADLFYNFLNSEVEDYPQNN